MTAKSDKVKKMKEDKAKLEKKIKKLSDLTNDTKKFNKLTPEERLSVSQQEAELRAEAIAIADKVDALGEKE